MGYNKKVVINGICFAFVIKGANKARIEVTPATANATPISIHQSKHNIGIIFTDDAKRKLLVEAVLLINNFDEDHRYFKATVCLDLASDTPFIEIKAKGSTTGGYENNMGITLSAVNALLENMYFVA